EQGAAQRDSDDARPEQDAVEERLDGEVDLAERRDLAEAEEDGQPVADDERIDERDEQRERDAELRGRRELVPRARGDPGTGHGDDHRAEQQRVLEGERARGERGAVGAAGRRARGVERARPAPEPHEAGSSGSATGRPPLTATAKRRPSARSVSDRAAAATPASSVPVTAQTGGSSPARVAAMRPVPAPSVRTGRPRASSATMRRPSALGRA